MSIKMTLLDASVAGPLTTAFVLLAFSGNYAAGGDVLDFTQLYGQTSKAGIQVAADGLPVDVDVDSLAGGWGASQGGYYVPVLYTKAAVPVALLPNLCKLQAFAAGGTEEAAGAYDSTILQDYVILRAVFETPK